MSTPLRQTIHAPRMDDSCGSQMAEGFLSHPLPGMPVRPADTEPEPKPSDGDFHDPPLGGVRAVDDDIRQALGL